MLEENKRDYEFSIEGNEGQMVRIHVSYYYPGTNYIITSASLEPNDPEEIEYEAYRESEEGDVGEALYDEDGVYDPQDVLEAIRRIEEGEDY